MVTEKEDDQNGTREGLHVRLILQSVWLQKKVTFSSYKWSLNIKATEWVTVGKLSKIHLDSDVAKDFEIIYN